MKKMVVRDLNDPSILKIKESTQVPHNFVCFTEYDDIDVLDIEEILSPTRHILGYKTVLNKEKVKNKERLKKEKVEIKKEDVDLHELKEIVDALIEQHEGSNSKLDVLLGKRAKVRKKEKT